MSRSVVVAGVVAYVGDGAYAAAHVSVSVVAADVAIIVDYRSLPLRRGCRLWELIAHSPCRG
jgi:hypothetical protein